MPKSSRWFPARGFAALLCALLLKAWVSPAKAEDPALLSARLADAETFEITARVPAGFSHAALEVWRQAGPWTVQITGAVDGRAGTAVFRLPRAAGGPSAMARMRCGTGTSPLPQLSDPALFSITYDGSGGEIPEETKIDNIGNLMEKYSDWETLPLAQRTANVKAFALTLPGVTDAGHSPLADTFYIKYADGDASLLIANRRTAATPSPAPAPPALPEGRTAAVNAEAAARQAKPAVTVAGADSDGGGADNGAPPGHPVIEANSIPEYLPASQDALCVYSLQPEKFPDSTPVVGKWLGSAGYSVVRQTTPTVTDIMAWKNRRLGVLFWQTHAGSLVSDDVSQEFLCIVSGEKCSAAQSQGPYKSLRSGPVRQLLIGGLKDYANPDNKKGIAYYAMTPAFLQGQLSGLFAAHSLSVLDACSGGHPEFGTLFTGLGSGTHVGWDIPSGQLAGESLEKMFDRLTGANETTPVSTPPERPFRMERVQTWMYDSGFDIDPSPPPDPGDPGFAEYKGPAHLRWHLSTTKPCFALRPSIFRAIFTAIDSSAPYEKWTLEGDFGDDPGDSSRLVSWGDKVLKIIKWTDDEGIVVQPPPPPYPTGPLEVMIGSRRSNLVPMTEWAIPITYTLTGKGSLEYRLQFTLRLRADIHQGRQEPQSQLSNHNVVPIQLTDTSGTMTASGQFKPDPDTTIKWSGSKTLGSFHTDNQGGTAASDFVLGSGTLNMQANTATLTLAVSVLSMADTFTTTPSGTTQGLLGTIMDGFFFPPLTTTINLQTGMLQGQSLTNTMPVSTENGISATLSWPSVQGQAAPLADTPR